MTEQSKKQLTESELPPMPRVILLNGFSGAGKTTVAREASLDAKTRVVISKFFATSLLDRFIDGFDVAFSETVIFNGLTANEVTIAFIDGFLENEELFRKFGKYDVAKGYVHNNVIGTIHGIRNSKPTKAGSVEYVFVDSVATKADLQLYYAAFGAQHVTVVELHRAGEIEQPGSARELLAVHTKRVLGHAARVIDTDNTDPSVTVAMCKAAADANYEAWA